ncbi:MAG: hypothetical protein GY842_09935, partial [bacterium]|nr:hypothetical protein [bacterium]
MGLVLALLLALLPVETGNAQQRPLVSYTPDDGLVASQLWDLLQDSRGYIWIAGSTGLSRWDGLSFVSFTAADGLHNPVIRTIVEDRLGNLWLGTHDGIVRY